MFGKEQKIELTTELAELCGIIAGDGHIHRHVSKKRVNYIVSIHGDKSEEVEYFNYISSLFVNVFNKTPGIRETKDSLCLYAHSKFIVAELEKLGMIIGKKARIVRIPKIFLNQKDLALAFLRGLADTDFSITFRKAKRKRHSYPIIKAEFASEKIIEDIQIILRRLKINHCMFKRSSHRFGKTFTPYSIDISGHKNLKTWLDYVGFSNLKHISKIMVARKLGYCPPHTTLAQRKKIIKSPLPDLNQQPPDDH